jgi:hypothetical protein
MTPYSRSEHNVNRISFLSLHNQSSDWTRIYRWERKDKQNYGASTEAWIPGIVTQLKQYSFLYVSSYRLCNSRSLITEVLQAVTVASTDSLYTSSAWNLSFHVKTIRYVRLHRHGPQEQWHKGFRTTSDQGICCGYGLWTKPKFQHFTWKLKRNTNLIRDQEFSFLHIVQTGSGAKPASYIMSIGNSSTRGKSDRGVKLTTHLQIVPRPRKCGSIHPLPP